MKIYNNGFMILITIAVIVLSPHAVRWRRPPSMVLILYIISLNQKSLFYYKDHISFTINAGLFTRNIG